LIKSSNVVGIGSVGAIGDLVVDAWEILSEQGGFSWSFQHLSIVCPMHWQCLHLDDF